MTTFWLNKDKVAVNSSGQPILCDRCPCSNNTCHSCVPPIPDTVYVTLTGLGGTFFDAYEGKNTLYWHLPIFGDASSCAWEGSQPGGGAYRCNYRDGWPYLALIYDELPARWAGWMIRIYLQAPTFGGGEACDIRFHLGAFPCSPIGEYTQVWCLDGGCEDMTSCENSAGATCVVSLT